MRTRRPAAAGLVLLLGVAGCSGPGDRKPVFPVRGTLAHRGEPLAGARVGFHPLGDPDPRAVFSTGTAAADGTYELTTYVTGDGVPAGAYAVTVYWPGKRSGPPKTGDEDIDLPPDRLNRAYADKRTTKLRETVRPEPNTIDINLP